MSISVSATSSSISVQSGSAVVQCGKKTSPAKPVWNPRKVYKYLEDMNQGFQSYKKQAVSYYRSMISQQEGSETMSVEDLKNEIKEWFPEYTLTNSEPSKVVPGKYYLYIDDSQLKKMASDPEYRAKVYGLMDSEIQGKNGYTLQYSDGRNVTSHLTGSIFSLCEANSEYAGPEGIPYRGSCTSDHPYSSSNSHAQVRSMSFIYDHIDPAKSAAKERKAAAVKAAEKSAKKHSEKKQAARKTAAEDTINKAAMAKEAAKKAAGEKTTEKVAEAERLREEELAREQEAERLKKLDESREAFTEWLEREMGTGAGRAFDTTA